MFRRGISFDQGFLDVLYVCVIASFQPAALQVLLELDQKDDGIAALQKLIAVQPKEACLHFHLAKVPPRAAGVVSCRRCQLLSRRCLSDFQMA